MSNQYPCPNPICVYEFDPAQLAGAASVTCPKCGIVIQLKAQPAAVPMATPVVPMARPVTVPMAQPIARPAPPEPLPDSDIGPPPIPRPGAPIVRSRKGGKGREWATYATLIAGVVILVGAAIGVAVIQMRDKKPSAFSAAGVFTNSDLNVKLTAPGGTWDQNSELRKAFDNSLLALQRPEPAAWFVLAARDYKDHDPSPKELDDEARTRLVYFKNVDTEPHKEAPLRAADTIAGHPTHVIVFFGDLGDDHVAGECHYFHYQGIGYWIYTWKHGTVDQRSDPDFPALMQKLSLLGERQKWKDVLANRKTFTSKKGYTLTDPTGRWMQEKDEDSVTAHDPAADMVLFATDPKDKLRPAVYLVAIVLPKTGDPVEAAKKHILEMQKRSNYDAATIRNASDGGEKETVGSVKGHLLRWDVQLTPDLTKFAVAGVVSHGDDVLLLYCECDLRQRNMWENQFLAVIDTLRWE